MNPQTTTHTEIPWLVIPGLHNGDEIYISPDGPGGRVVCAVWPMGEDFSSDGPTRAANAELICRAVNSHAQLVAANRDALTYLDTLPPLPVGSVAEVARAAACHGLRQSLFAAGVVWSAQDSQARRALSLGEGGSVNLTIKLDLDNAAFADGQTEEVQRILTDLCTRLPDPLRDTDGALNLHDINGNHVGTARIT